MTNQINKTKLFKDIVKGLQEDIGRFVDDYDSVGDWERICLDCPSSDLEPLLGQIPSEEMDEWYDLIGEEVSKLGDKVREQFDEEEE